MADENKACPACGEQILAIAKKCKHCGEWFSTPHAEQSRANPPPLPTRRTIEGSGNPGGATERTPGEPWRPTRKAIIVASVVLLAAALVFVGTNKSALLAVGAHRAATGTQTAANVCREALARSTQYAGREGVCEDIRRRTDEEIQLRFRKNDDQLAWGCNLTPLLHQPSLVSAWGAKRPAYLCYVTMTSVFGLNRWIEPEMASFIWKALDPNEGKNPQLPSFEPPPSRPAR